MNKVKKFFAFAFSCVARTFYGLALIADWLGDTFGSFADALEPVEDVEFDVSDYADEDVDGGE